jgi:aminocarboxymuconate-semialdehyde decarboxylase
LGTDYPFPLGEVTGYADAYPGKAILESKEFDDKLKEKLLFDNGMKFLGLNPQDYV